jgi:hypothetical protein
MTDLESEIRSRPVSTLPEEAAPEPVKRGGRIHTCKTLTQEGNCDCTESMHYAKHCGYSDKWKQQKSCPHFKEIPDYKLEERDAAIERAAREKVLIEILAFVDAGEISLPDEESEESNDYVFSGELRAKIDSLQHPTTLAPTKETIETNIAELKKLDAEFQENAAKVITNMGNTNK